MFSSCLSKVLANEPLQVPQQGPYGEGGPLTGHFAYLSKTSSYGFPSPKVPLLESFAESYPTTRALLHSSIKVPGIRAPPLPAYQVPLDWKWASTKMPVSGDFLNISSRVPSEGAPPPRPPPRSLFRERDTSSTEPPLPSTKVAGR